MASSKATTVSQYIRELPSAQRAVISKLRAIIRKNLPDGYVEAMNWGMISYEIPLKRYPDTYNRQPLGIAALAAQKNYFALYLNCIYMDGERARTFAEGFRESGKKLDMGKSCVRFKSLDDLPLDLIAKTIAGMSVQEHIEIYEASRLLTTAGRKRAGR